MLSTNAQGSLGIIAIKLIPILLSLYSVVIVIRRRFFHTLSKYPGPLVNSLTELPAAIHLARGTQQFYYKSLHEKYGKHYSGEPAPSFAAGPVVRVAPNELSFINAQAWEDIYGFRKSAPNMEKSPVFIGAVAKAPDGSMGISMAPLATKDHSRQRGAMAYCFTNQALLQQQSLMRTHIDKLVDQLRKLIRQGQPADMSNWYTYTTFDLMGDITFGQPFGCLDQGSATDWSRAIINVFVSGAWEQAIRRVAGVGTWLSLKLTKLLVPRKAAMWRQLHFMKSKETTAARLKDGAMRDHPDVIHQILKNKESRNSLTDTEIFINMVLFISAGGETTAGTLTAWTYFYCTQPQTRQRLIKEVRESGVFNSEADITWENVGPDKLPYLDATISEALRLFAPAAASQQRIVPKGGATIDGKYVPEGVCVAIPPYGSTRLSCNFKDPDEFHPERWLSDPKYADDKLDASQPFSLGPRVCIGKNLAYFELRLILVHMLWNFDMELASGPLGKQTEAGWGDSMKHIKGYLTWLKPPLWVSLKEVEH